MKNSCLRKLVIKVCWSKLLLRQKSYVTMKQLATAVHSKWDRATEKYILVGTPHYYQCQQYYLRMLVII